MSRTIPRGTDVEAVRGPDPGETRQDHSAEMRAIAEQLERLSGTASSQGDRAAPSAPGRLDALRDAVAAIARRQADLDGQGEASRPDASATDAETVTAGSAAQPPELSVRGAPIERQPTSVHDRISARGATPSLAAGSPDVPAPSAVRRANLDLSSEVSQTFARFAQDLHEAIRATDARPDVQALGQALGREVRQVGRAVDALGAPPSTVQASPDALARIGAQTAEMRDLLKGSTARTVPFDGVERQMAALEARLGRLAAAPEPVAPPPHFSDTMAEVRALLDGLKPGATMAALETRLDAISERIERGLDARGPSGLIEGLSRRVDEIHASLRSQLAEAAVDTRPLEGLVRGLSERIGQARVASADFNQLEAAVRDVGAKIDGAASLDPRSVQAIEAQLARLGERLDRSEASLRSLDGVEGTLGELFAQFEVTRQVAIDAAETAARTAARDTLRAALQNPNLSARGADISPHAVDHMARSLDDIRNLHDSAERRTQSALSDIQIAVDRLAGQIAASGINAGGVVAGSRAAPAGEALRSRFAPEPISDGAADPAFDPAAQMIEPGLGRGPSPSTARGQTLRAEPRFDADPAPAAAPEPASATPAAPSLPPNADGDGPASFIAAARRAAQAAQASAAATAAAKAADRRLPARPASRRRRAAPEASSPGASPEIRTGFGGLGRSGEAGTGTLDRARSFLAQRRRPILLSLAALVFLVGALEIAKLSADTGSTNRAGEAPSARLASTAVSAPAVAKSDVGGIAGSADMPKPVLPPAAAPAPAPLPTFVAGPAKPVAQADGIGEGLRTAAAAGDPGAQYEIGLRYSDGRGAARDPKQAVAWFNRAAAAGSIPAEYRLGSAYEKGAGVERDPALAMSWYGKAAEAGNVRAMHNLAVMSAEGAGGKPDYAKAAQWFGKASTYGVRDSQFNLAILYARGLGIEQSLPQSYTWFAIAAAEGDEDAGRKRDEVAAKLDAKALASAKAAAEAFHAAVPSQAANEVTPPPGGWDAAPRPAGATPAANAKVSQL